MPELGQSSALVACFVPENRLSCKFTQVLFLFVSCDWRLICALVALSVGRRESFVVWSTIEARCVRFDGRVRVSNGVVIKIVFVRLKLAAV